MSWEMWGLPFVRMAIGAGLLVGVMASYLGVWVVLRRVVFVGIALAQVATLGVALSFYVPWPPLPLALIATLAAAWFLSDAGERTRIPREAGIGAVYVASAAASILLVAKSAQGETHVLGLLFGNILTVTAGDLLGLAGVAVAVLGLHLGFAKEILFVSFDPETARAAGYRVRGWNLLFDVTLALAIAMSIRVAGALLVFSFLVQPAMVGLRLSTGLRGTFLWALGSAAVATLAGVAISLTADLPTGPAIVAVQSGLVLLSLPVRRGR